TGAPKVRLGTKWPSITSIWIQSAPASSSALTSSPRRAKSAERMEAPMRMERVTDDPAVVSDDLGHGGGSVGHAVGEAPFVVVPAHDAHQRAVHDLGLVHVEDRGMGIVVEVDRDVGTPGE